MVAGGQRFVLLSIVIRCYSNALLLRGLSRAIADSGMAGFLAKLACKCSWYGADYVKADPWFPSSKLCAHCGWHNGEMVLSDRQWWCGSCGALNDRDGNAAENLSQWPSSSFSVSGRGDRVSPAMPAVASEASISLPAAAGLDLGQIKQIRSGF